MPAPPGLPDIVDWDEKSAKLKWEPPIRDNGAPITGYVIEVMDRDRGEFVKVSLGDSFVNLYPISHLFGYVT